MPDVALVRTRALLAFGLTLLLGACASKKEASPAAPTGPKAMEVRTVTAQRGLLERETRASATVQAEKDSLVAAGASGRVLKALPAGSRVQAGDGVVYLDPAPFQEALEAARLNLKQAQTNLERTQNQLAGNLAALKAQLQAAEAQLQGARRRYEEGQSLLAIGALAPLDLKALEAQYRQAESAYQKRQGSPFPPGEGGGPAASRTPGGSRQAPGTPGGEKPQGKRGAGPLPRGGGGGLREGGGVLGHGKPGLFASPPRNASWPSYTSPQNKPAPSPRKPLLPSARMAGKWRRASYAKPTSRARTGWWRWS